MRITLLSVGVAIFLFLSLWLYKKNRNNTPITVLNTRKLYKKYYVTVALPVGGNRLYLFFTTCYVAWRLAWGKKKINCEDAEHWPVRTKLFTSFSQMETVDKWLYLFELTLVLHFLLLVFSVWLFW